MARRAPPNRSARARNEALDCMCEGAGGLPIGAVLLTQRVADVMAPGDHGSTFAGNPLVCAAASRTFDIISDTAFLDSVAAKGERLRDGLKAAFGDNPDVLVSCVDPTPTLASCSVTAVV